MSATRAWLYHACGLVIGSDAPIGGFPPAVSDARPDVTVSFEATMSVGEYPALWYASPEVNASGAPEMTIEAGPTGYRLTYGGQATFVVSRSGDRIAADGAVHTGVDYASYLSGSVLGFVLRLRGLVPLHASAVAVEGRGVLFVGESWSGKSSLAAAFSLLGYPLLSDDIVRVDAIAGQVVAYPCQPLLNVWGDSAAALFGSIHGNAYQKHALPMLAAGCQFHSTPAPIGVVYVLTERGTGREPVIRDLPPRDAFITLIRHSYGGCFLNGEMRAHEFGVISRLVEQVPVRELTLADDLRTLVKSCRTLVMAGQEPALHAR